MDAILGQDIMLSHHCRLDLSKLTLGLKGKTLSCWTPWETALSCRVLVKEETVLPPWSEKILPVTVTNAGYLATNGIVQPSPEVITEQEILLIPGVVSTHGESVQVRVINFGDDEVTLHPKQNLGTCESYYDQSSSGPAIMPAAELRRIQEVSTTLTDTLEKMVIESSTEMSSNERRQWADLVERYQGILLHPRQIWEGHLSCVIKSTLEQLFPSGFLLGDCHWENAESSKKKWRLCLRKVSSSLPLVLGQHQ